MPTGYTTVSATNCVDASGNKVASGTIAFQPCNNQGVPMSFKVNGNGQTISLPVTSTVTNGAFSLNLADTSLTTPVNVAYKVTLTDPSGRSLLGSGYLIQPTGATWNFDTFALNGAGLATIQTGPTGAQGAPGIASLAQLATQRTKLPAPQISSTQALSPPAATSMARLVRLWLIQDSALPITSSPMPVAK